MAIDTRDKRNSAIHVTSPWRGMLPNTPAGTLDDSDRLHVAYLYRGIAAGGPVTPSPSGQLQWTFSARPRLDRDATIEPTLAREAGIGG